MFAMLTGLMNLSNGFTSKMLGNAINSFVGVHEKNLTDLWVLYIIQAACSLLPLAFIWLIPNKLEVEGVQKAIEFIEKNEHAPFYEIDSQHYSDDGSDGKSGRQNSDTIESSGAGNLDANTLAVLKRIRPQMYKRILDDRLIKAGRYIVEQSNTTMSTSTSCQINNNNMNYNLSEFSGQNKSRRSNSYAGSKSPISEFN